MTQDETKKPFPVVLFVCIVVIMALAVSRIMSDHYSDHYRPILNDMDNTIAALDREIASLDQAIAERAETNEAISKIVFEHMNGDFGAAAHDRSTWCRFDPDTGEDLIGDVLASIVGDKIREQRGEMVVDAETSVGNQESIKVYRTFCASFKPYSADEIRAAGFLSTQGKP